MKNIKKIISILILFTMICLLFTYTYAASTYELEFEIINNNKNEKIDIYLLLPKEYILFAIEESYAVVHYNGSNTLKQNEIYGIKVNKENVLDEEYLENDIEYVQILLDEENGKYKFDILEDYKKMNIKFRIISGERDYIVHIDNFKIQNNKCKIQYNYQRDIVKQADRLVIPNSVIILIIILVIVVILGGISYIKQKREG